MKVEEPKRCLEVQKGRAGVILLVCVMTWLNIPGIQKGGRLVVIAMVAYVSFQEWPHPAMVLIGSAQVFSGRHIPTFLM